MRLLFFFICWLFFIHALSSQPLNKKLQTKTWYCTCDFASDSLVLSDNKTDNTEWEASFTVGGKVNLRHLKENTRITLYSYSFTKRAIRFFYDQKDSLANLNYEISPKRKDGSYLLTSFYKLRYKKKNAGDTPPADYFTLVNGTKKKTVYNLSEITVHRMEKGLKHDSVESVYKGDFLEYGADTLLLNTYQFSKHNFYKHYTDTNHYFSEFLFDSLIQTKIPVNEITKIYAARERFSNLVNGMAIGALGTFIVSLPLALAIKSDPANTVFTHSAVYSALSMPVIVFANIIFSKQKFTISGTDKKKNTWQFESRSSGVLKK